MTREEAVKAVMSTNPRTDTFARDIVDALAALGLIKFDEPTKLRSPFPDYTIITLCGLNAGQVQALINFFYSKTGESPENYTPEWINVKLRQACK